MLQKLQITNFQKHSRLRIKLDPEITAIVGPSDTGKSSIIRSLRWLATNKPRGDSFIREGTNNSSIKLLVDGHTIERSKGKKGNTYTIDKKQLSSFGSEVPDLISNILRIGEDNISGQHSPPFWFSLTSGEVAKKLNQIVDLEVIDNIVGNIASRIRKSKTELEVIEDRLREAKNKQSSLDYVPKLSNELKSVEEKQEEMWSTSRQAVSLAISVVDGRKLWGVVDRALESILDGRTVLELGGRYQQVFTKLNKLVDLIGKVKEAESKAELEIPSLNELELLKEEAESKVKKYFNLVSIFDEAVNKEYLLEVIGFKLDIAKNKLKYKTKGLCPICGSNISI